MKNLKTSRNKPSPFVPLGLKLDEIYEVFAEYVILVNASEPVELLN